MVCRRIPGHAVSLKAGIMTRFKISNKFNLNLSALDFQPQLEQFGP
jgi:hypothetical protein